MFKDFFILYDLPSLILSLYDLSSLILSYSKIESDIFATIIPRLDFEHVPTAPGIKKTKSGG